MIRITRVPKRVDILMGYRIIIDGYEYGTVRNGKTKDFEVENGSHTVSVSSGRYESKSIRVNVSDSIVELEVGCALTGWRYWLWPYSDFLVKKDEYLFIREKDKGGDAG